MLWDKTQCASTRSQLERRNGIGTGLYAARSWLESWLGTFHELNPARRDVETHAQLLVKAFGPKMSDGLN